MRNCCFVFIDARRKGLEVSRSRATLNLSVKVERRLVTFTIESFPHRIKAHLTLFMGAGRVESAHFVLCIAYQEYIFTTEP